MDESIIDINKIKEEIESRILDLYKNKYYSYKLRINELLLFANRFNIKIEISPCYNTLDHDQNIYFVRKIGTNECKIGRSINPNKRLKSFKTGNALDIKVEKTINITEIKNEFSISKLENLIQRYFSKSKIVREWFSLNENEVKLFVDKVYQEGTFFLNKKK